MKSFQRTKKQLYGLILLVTLPLFSQAQGDYAEEHYEQHTAPVNIYFTVAQKQAMEEVIGRYAHAWDGKDLEALLNLFTEDAVWEQFLSGRDEPAYRANSRDEIAMMAYYSFNFVVVDINTRHHQTNVVFEALDKRSAITKTTVLITHQGPQDPAPRTVISGVYTDDWRKTREGWKITRRSLKNDLQPQ